MTKRILSLAGLVVLVVSSALAQQTSISGKITDASGAVVAGATVTANRADGGAGYATSTNGGAFTNFLRSRHRITPSGSKRKVLLKRKDS